jgi:hypothetical protein
VGLKPLDQLQRLVCRQPDKDLTAVAAWAPGVEVLLMRSSE